MTFDRSTSILVFDSAEKTAGTSVKHLLRKNFAENCFFDYDNGDPPDVTWRNYGIKCAVEGVPGSQAFFDNRGAWLEQNHRSYDLQCVYGHGLWQGRKTIQELLADSERKLVLARFLREPAERIASEYFYVLTNEGHPLHRGAMEAGSLEAWFESPIRPKDRQTRAILGVRRDPCGDAAFDVLMKEYAYFGLVEFMNESIYFMCREFDLAHVEVPHLNITKNKKAPSDIRSYAREKYYDYDKNDYVFYDKVAPYFMVYCKEKMLMSA